MYEAILEPTADRIFSMKQAENDEENEIDLLPFFSSCVFHRS
jgi:hypothetical protein